MPKWINKGHEFDALGNIFKTRKNIVIVAKNENSTKIKNNLDFLNTNITMLETFPDLSQITNSSNLAEKFKYYFEQKNKVKFLNSTFIISDELYEEEKLKLKKYNLIENVHFFSENLFFNHYLPIFAVYTKNKVYFPSNCLICTTVCTLNCKDCLNFAPYDKNKQHFDINRLKQDIDIYFKSIDRVGLFHISGGEPFSYPYLAELIEYIGKNYRNKIDILGTVTNMTLIPSDKLCETLKKYNVRVELDDYTKTNPDKKEQYNKVLNKINKYEIYTQLNIAGERWNWVSIFPPTRVTIDDDELKNKFTKCGSVFQELKNGKLFGCCCCEFIAQAGCYPFVDTDYYDLTKFNNKRKELVEFRLKYNTKGYVDFCKYCNGLPYYNNNYIEPAIQAKECLEWNIDSPCKIQNK